MNMAKEKAKKEKKKSSFWKDFKAFISRGNIVDLAVAVVVGAAFTAIVNSLVNDVIKPLITLLFGGEDMSDLVVVLRTIVDPDTNEIVDTITGREETPTRATSMRFSPKPSRMTASCRTFFDVYVMPFCRPGPQ